MTTEKDPRQPGSTHQIYDLGYEIGITKKKNETNNEVQSLITKMSNDEFEKKINF